MSIKIDKRVPFGFNGIWAKCYKLKNFNETKDSISYQNSDYYDIGFFIQLKDTENGINKSTNNTQSIENLVTEGVVKYYKTADACFKDGKYECIVEINDILRVGNDFYVVERIDEKSIYTPARQTFYYLTTKKVFIDGILGDK